MIHDPTFWLFILGFVQIGTTAICFLTIKFNDLKHLDIKVDGLVKDLAIYQTTIIKIDKRQAVQEEKIKTLEKKK